jgi:hypothetical protein
LASPSPTLVALRFELQEGQRRLRALTDLAQEFVYLRSTDGVGERGAALPDVGAVTDRKSVV